MRQFAGHSLVVEHGRLFCKACKFAPPNKAQSIKIHLKSPSHVQKLDVFKKRVLKDERLTESLVEWATRNPDVVGTTQLSEEQLLFRYQVVVVFMASGTPLERAPFFRTLLERSRITVGDVSNLKMFIPRVEENEKERLTKEISSQWVSSQFDGTTRLGEAINLVNRWCTVDFELRQRLTLFQTTLKHVNSQQLSSLVATHLLRKMQVHAQCAFFDTATTLPCTIMPSTAVVQPPAPPASRPHTDSC